VISIWSILWEKNKSAPFGRKLKIVADFICHYKYDPKSQEGKLKKK